MYKNPKYILAIAKYFYSVLFSMSCLAEHLI